MSAMNIAPIKGGRTVNTRDFVQGMTQQECVGFEASVIWGQLG